MNKSNNYRRYNPLLDSWVIVAANRVNRPWQGAQTGTNKETCFQETTLNQLAPGGARANGEITPNYLATFVFDNDFPTFTEFDAPSEKSSDDPLFQQETVRGCCRVICYHPASEITIATMKEDEVLNVVNVWVDQFNELKNRYTWVQIFENRGAAVGCSNSHPHGQLWAGDFLPSLPARKDINQKAYFEKYGKPMLVDYLEKELKKGERIVLKNENWTVLVPFWAFWPFETILLPNRHIKNLSQLTSEEKTSLASILQQLLIKYDNIFHCTFPFSMGWSGAPSGQFLDKNDDHWQLHAAFHPPLLRSANIPKFMAGYEVFAEQQRDITPEAAAEIIRSQPCKHFSLCE